MTAPPVYTTRMTTKGKSLQLPVWWLLFRLGCSCGLIDGHAKRRVSVKEGSGYMSLENILACFLNNTVYEEGVRLYK